MGVDELPFSHQFVPAQQTRSPLLLLLPDTQGRESELLSFGREVFADAALLLLEAAALQERRSLGEPAERQGTAADHVRRHIHELAAFLAGAVSRYELEGRPVLVLGLGHGATLGTGLLLLNRWAVAGEALIRPRVPLVPEVPPFLSGTPVWISARRDDPQIPAEETEQLVAILREAGAEVSLDWSPGDVLLASHVAPIRAWLDPGAAQEPG